MCVEMFVDVRIDLCLQVSHRCQILKNHLLLWSIMAEAVSWMAVRRLLSPHRLGAWQCRCPIDHRSTLIDASSTIGRFNNSDTIPTLITVSSTHRSVVFYIFLSHDIFSHGRKKKQERDHCSVSSRRSRSHRYRSRQSPATRPTTCSYGRYPRPTATIRYSHIYRHVLEAWRPCFFDFEGYRRRHF